MARASTKPARVLADRYELVDRIGAGGMAEVWRGRDRRLGRDVAVKILAGPAAREESRRRRIEREARTLAAFSDPGIVAVYDYGEEQTDGGDVTPFVVMELVDGPDLHRYLRDEGRLDSRRATEILGPIVAAVGRAHDAGIVHGDLKPANIFIDAAGPKVGDFGVARVLDEETGATTLAATPAFAAPEVLRGAKPTPASDVYSLACLAFEMLSGHPPYEGANAWEVAAKHLEAPIPSVRVSRPDVPVELDEAIRAGMHKDPQRRPRPAGAFAASIGTTEATMPVVVATQPVTAAPEETVQLPSRPDLERVAVLGPFAGLAARLRRSRPGRPRQRGLAAALVLGVAIPVVLLIIGLRPNTVAVPDVRGESVAAAKATLERAGLGTSEVSYQPVTDGGDGVVVRTAPAAGAHVRRGTQVRMVATSLEAIPAPTPVPQLVVVPPAPVQPVPHDHKPHGHTKGRD